MFKPTTKKATKKASNYAVIILRHGEDMGAMRITMQDTTGTGKMPEFDEDTKKNIGTVIDAYAGSLGWDRAKVEVSFVAPLSEVESRTLYDALPGDRMSDHDINKMVTAIGPHAQSMRPLVS